MNRSSYPTEMPPFDVDAYARSMTGGAAMSDLPPCLAPIHDRRSAERPRAIAALLDALLSTSTPR